MRISVTPHFDIVFLALATHWTCISNTLDCNAHCAHKKNPTRLCTARYTRSYISTHREATRPHNNMPTRRLC